MLKFQVKNIALSSTIPNVSKASWMTTPAYMERSVLQKIPILIKCTIYVAIYSYMVLRNINTTFFFLHIYLDFQRNQDLP